MHTPENTKHLMYHIFAFGYLFILLFCFTTLIVVSICCVFLLLIMISFQQHYFLMFNACVQRVEKAHYWYYMLELGFYWSLLLCVSVDVKRKVSAMFF